MKKQKFYQKIIQVVIGTTFLIWVVYFLIKGLIAIKGLF